MRQPDLTPSQAEDALALMEFLCEQEACTGSAFGRSIAAYRADHGSQLFRMQVASLATALRGVYQRLHQPPVPADAPLAFDFEFIPALMNHIADKGQGIYYALSLCESDTAFDTLVDEVWPAQRRVIVHLVVGSNIEMEALKRRLLTLTTVKEVTTIEGAPL